MGMVGEIISQKMQNSLIYSRLMERNGMTPTEMGMEIISTERKVIGSLKIQIDGPIQIEMV